MDFGEVEASLVDLSVPRSGADDDDDAFGDDDDSDDLDWGAVGDDDGEGVVVCPVLTPDTGAVGLEGGSLEGLADLVGNAMPDDLADLGLGGNDGADDSASVASSDSSSEGSDWDAEFASDSESAGTGGVVSEPGVSFRHRLGALRNLVKDDQRTVHPHKLVAGEVAKRYRLMNAVSSSAGRGGGVGRQQVIVRYPKPSELYTLTAADGIARMNETQLEQLLSRSVLQSRKVYLEQAHGGLGEEGELSGMGGGVVLHARGPKDGTSVLWISSRVWRCRSALLSGHDRQCGDMATETFTIMRQSCKFEPRWFDDVLKRDDQVRVLRCSLDLITLGVEAWGKQLASEAARAEAASQHRATDSWDILKALTTDMREQYGGMLQSAAVVLPSCLDALVAIDARAAAHVLGNSEYLHTVAATVRRPRGRDHRGSQQMPAICDWPWLRPPRSLAQAAHGAGSRSSPMSANKSKNGGRNGGRDSSGEVGDPADFVSVGATALNAEIIAQYCTVYASAMMKLQREVDGGEKDNTSSSLPENSAGYLLVAATSALHLHSTGRSPLSFSEARYLQDTLPDDEDYDDAEWGYSDCDVPAGRPISSVGSEHVDALRAAASSRQSASGSLLAQWASKEASRGEGALHKQGASTSSGFSMDGRGGSRSFGTDPQARIDWELFRLDHDYSLDILLIHYRQLKCIRLLKSQASCIIGQRLLRRRGENRETVQPEWDVAEQILFEGVLVLEALERFGESQGATPNSPTTQARARGASLAVYALGRVSHMITHTGVSLLTR